jgi:hypothetical protein
LAWGVAPLLGMDRGLLEDVFAGQFQPPSQPSGLFRHGDDGALWLASRGLESRGSKEPLEPASPWLPQGGSLTLLRSSRGGSTADLRLDLRPLPQDPFQVRVLLDDRPANNGQGAQGRNQTRGLGIRHQRALELGLLESDWQWDRWTDQAPLPGEREEWLLGTGAAREQGSRLRTGLRWSVSLADDLGLRLDLQAAVQRRELEREELDRLYQRGITTTDFQASDWFSTQRDHLSRRFATALTADWAHARGHFRLALWLEHLREDHEGRLPDPETPGNGVVLPWYSLEEGHWSSGLRLADRYALWGPLRVELDVCARYQSYFFGRGASPAYGGAGSLEFDDNLLVLEPRLALVLEQAGRSWLMGWSRFNPMLDPLDYWDLNRAPTSAYSEPLFIQDAEGSAVPRLRTPRSQQLELALELRQGPYRGGFLLQASRFESRVGAWYKEDGQALPDPQLSNGGKLELLEAGFWLESRLSPRTRFDGSLQLGCGRWRDAQLVLPLEDSSLDGLGLPLSAPVGTLFYGPAGRYRVRDLDHRPAPLPAFGMTARLDHSLRPPWPGDLRLVLDGEYRTPSQADPSGQAGLTNPGVRRLDLGTHWSLERWPGWKLELAGRNLLDQAWQGEGLVRRFRDGTPARLDRLSAAPLSMEIKLVRNW